MSLSTFIDWLTNFAPHPGVPMWRERVRRCAGALIGIGSAALSTRYVFGEAGDIPMLIAPMGASAVLLFGAFESPLAQPWSILGGNLVSAFIGVACTQWIADPGTAAAVAVALAIAAMYALRCVHPPSGAVALTAVLGGPAVHALGVRFVIEPVLFQSVALLAAALVYHALTGHRYPHKVVHAAPQHKTDSERAREARFDAVPDVFWRGYDEITCEHVMSTDVRAVPSTMHRKAARELLHREGVTALHVVDAMHRLVGVVTHGDLAEASAPLLKRLWRALRRGSARVEETVEAVMTAAVHAVHQATPLAGLVPAFTDHAISSIPVLDDGQRLVGEVKHSDMIRWLHRQAGEARIVARAP